MLEKISFWLTQNPPFGIKPLVSSEYERNLEIVDWQITASVEILKISCAEVVELVDTLDLGSSTARCGSSSLLFGTILKQGVNQIG